MTDARESIRLLTQSLEAQRKVIDLLNEQLARLDAENARLADEVCHLRARTTTTATTATPAPDHEEVAWQMR